MCTLLDVHILKNHRPLLGISLQRKWMTDDSLITIIVYRFNIHQLSSLVSRWTMFSYDLTCTSLSTCVCIVLCSVNCVCSLLSCNVTGYCENEASTYITAWKKRDTSWRYIHALFWSTMVSSIFVECQF